MQQSLHLNPTHTHDLPGGAATLAPGGLPHRGRERRRALWESVIVSAVTLLIVGAGIGGLWLTSRQSIHNNFHHHLVSLAQSAASMVDPALHEAIRRPEQLNDATYLRAVTPLRRLSAAVAEIHYVYTLVLDGSQVHFVLDATDPGAERQSTVWEVFPDRNPAMMAALGARGAPGHADATDSPYTDHVGSFMTGYAPLLDAKGAQIGVVGVDANASAYLARLAAARDHALMGLLPAGVLILALGIGFHFIRLKGLLAVTAEAATAESLRQSETTFRSLFELSPVGFSLTDLQTGRYLSVNDAFVASSGYTREELLRLTVWDLTPASYNANVQATIAEMGRRERYGPYQKEHVRKNGTRYPVMLSGSRLRDAAGREVVWSIVQDISERKAMESALLDAARRDKLTGLANRAFFMERLRESMVRVRAEQQRLYAVLFLDFDRFKLINDTLGHGAGDELLRQIAQRLTAALRSTDAAQSSDAGNLIGRLGGDEFLVLLNDLQCAADARVIADRLLHALSQPYQIFGSDVHTSASVGIVTSEQTLADADEVVRNADVAMYEAKRAGRACAVVFNDAMHTRLTRHLTIETALRKAIGTTELSLVYQPIVSLETREMVSAEALLRWQHPTLGPISPSEFIPVAEDSGLIVPLGRWVQAEACKALSRWRAQDPARAPQTVSVNVSRAELALGNRFVEQLKEILEEAQLPPEFLQLEITEREVMRDPMSSAETLRALQRMGIQLAMDDFGTGSSSLAFLRDYPFNTIKIDRSFISDLAKDKAGTAVMRAAVALVENLGMTSVAEGVENTTQVAVIRGLGCRLAQGFHFSRPVPAERLLTALRPHAGSVRVVAPPGSAGSRRSVGSFSGFSALPGIAGQGFFAAPEPARASRGSQSLSRSARRMSALGAGLDGERDRVADQLTGQPNLPRVAAVRYALPGQERRAAFEVTHLKRDSSQHYPLACRKRQ